MREILFRAKRIDIGEWVYGDLITKPVHHECVILENGVINYSVNSETVGQFTGHTDKNGKKVFEGDSATALTPIGKFNGVVKFNGGAFVFVASVVGVEMPSLLLTDLIEIRISGNIHEFLND